jgi:hypothetical protein
MVKDLARPTPNSVLAVEKAKAMRATSYEFDR